MSEIPALLKRASALAKKAGRKEATVSKWLFRDANTLKRLRSGGDCTVTTLLRAKDELARRELLLTQQREARRESSR
jgi:hypothetical protein